MRPLILPTAIQGDIKDQQFSKNGDLIPHSIPSRGKLIFCDNPTQPKTTYPLFNATAIIYFFYLIDRHTSLLCNRFIFLFCKPGGLSQRTKRIKHSKKTKQKKTVVQAVC